MAENLLKMAGGLSIKVRLSFGDLVLVLLLHDHLFIFISWTGLVVFLPISIWPHHHGGALQVFIILRLILHYLQFYVELITRLCVCTVCIRIGCLSRTSHSNNFSTPLPVSACLATTPPLPFPSSDKCNQQSIGIANLFGGGGVKKTDLVMLTLN